MNCGCATDLHLTVYLLRNLHLHGVDYFTNLHLTILKWTVQLENKICIFLNDVQQDTAENVIFQFTKLFLSWIHFGPHNCKLSNLTLYSTPLQALNNNFQNCYKCDQTVFDTKLDTIKESYTVFKLFKPHLIKHSIYFRIIGRPIWTFSQAKCKRDRLPQIGRVGLYKAFEIVRIMKCILLQSCFKSRI